MLQNLLLSVTILQYLLFCSARNRNISSEKNGVDTEVYRIRRLQENVSSVLDSLLNNYQKTLRPRFRAGTPTMVKVDLNIRSMGPISESEMSYSMDCYFRQVWADERLNFSAPLSMLAIDQRMLEKIWKPDTYFWNGGRSYLHDLTVPNKLVRLSRSGEVLYSVRLTIKASCSMSLRNFPMDQHICPLVFGSFAYTDKDIVYQWRHGNVRSVTIEDDLQLPQFALTGFTMTNVTVESARGRFAVMRVNFHIKRHAGYFVLQFYVPCSLLVVLTWVSFWLNRQAYADRVSLCITSILTLTTLQLEIRTSLPRVAYMTALDVYFVKCFLFIVAALIQFALVHFFTKDEETLAWSSSPSENEITNADTSNEAVTSNRSMNSLRGVFGMLATQSSFVTAATFSKKSAADIKGNKLLEKAKRRNPLQDCFYCLTGNMKYRYYIGSLSKRNINSISILDRVARFLFPVTFIIANAVYWSYYARADDEYSHQPYLM